MTNPKEVKEMIEGAGGTVDSMTLFDDGHGNATASFSLPEDHWLYADDGEYEPPPMPMRMGTDSPNYSVLRSMVIDAARYAIRASTMKGKEEDFDPDALVQNMHIGLFGYHTPDGTSGQDHWANPDPLPPAFSWPNLK